MVEWYFALDNYSRIIINAGIIGIVSAITDVVYNRFTWLNASIMFTVWSILVFGGHY